MMSKVEMFSQFSFWRYGIESASAASATVTIRVEGMHCGNCATSIKKKLKATAGVEDVRVSFEKKEAWIKFDDQKITVAQLREIINSTGFKAVEEKPDSQLSVQFYFNLIGEQQTLHRRD